MRGFHICAISVFFFFFACGFIDTISFQLVDVKYNVYYSVLIFFILHVILFLFHSIACHVQCCFISLKFFFCVTWRKKNTHATRSWFVFVSRKIKICMIFHFPELIMNFPVSDWREFDAIETLVHMKMQSSPIAYWHAIPQPLRSVFSGNKEYLLLIPLLARLFGTAVPVLTSDCKDFLYECVQCITPCLRSACPTWKSGMSFAYGKSKDATCSMVARLLAIIGVLARPFQQKWTDMFVTRRHVLCYHAEKKARKFAETCIEEAEEPSAKRICAALPANTLSNVPATSNGEECSDEIVTVYTAHHHSGMAVCITTTDSTSQWNDGSGIVIFSRNYTASPLDTELGAMLVAVRLLKSHRVCRRRIVIYPESDFRRSNNLTKAGDFDAQRVVELRRAIQSLTSDPYHCQVTVGVPLQHLNAVSVEATRRFAQRASEGRNFYMNCSFKVVLDEELNSAIFKQ